jgi:hypothetical protein
LLFTHHPGPDGRNIRVARFALKKLGSNETNIVFFPPGGSIGLGSRAVRRVRILKLINGISEIN